MLENVKCNTKNRLGLWNCFLFPEFLNNMGTEILKSFGTLQSELEQAKNSLKGVDENIKRLIGRDPSEFLNRPGNKRPQNEDRNRLRGPPNKNRNTNMENDDPPNKRKKDSVFKRLSEKPNQYEEELPQSQKGLISKVIVTPREIPSRQEALAAQSKDVKSKERNRRMFGALLGTLQKFQQEETKLKQREEKRAQLEKKIEEHEIKEKAEIKKERQELFLNRKKKQAEIKMIELKMMRMREYAIWEERQKPLMNYIRTKSKPHIFYLPKRPNEKHKALLEESKKEIEGLIEKKKQSVVEELQRIEERMKKNFEPKLAKDDMKENNKVENGEEEDKAHNGDIQEEHHSDEKEMLEAVKSVDNDQSNDNLNTNKNEEESKEEMNINNNEELTRTSLEKGDDSLQKSVTPDEGDPEKQQENLTENSVKE